MSENSSDILRQPPFPELKWDGYGWSAEIVLPTWQGFQSRLGAYGSCDNEVVSDGLTTLSIYTVDDEPSALLPEQERAFKYLLDNQEIIRDTILKTILEAYSQWQEDYGYDEAEIAKYMPVLQNQEQLKGLMGLSAVHILPIAKDGFAYVGFEFGCTWDDEHGLGALTNQNHIAETGHASVSFDQGLCEKDIDPIAYEAEVAALYEEASRRAAAREAGQKQTSQDQNTLPFDF